AHVEAEQRLVLPEVRQEEAQLAQRVEGDVVVEGAAGGDGEAPVATLAERHAGSPDRARGHRRRGRRLRDRAAHPALREVEAERARQPRGPGAGRAHHRRRADLPVLGDDAADGARPRAHALHRTLEVEARAVREGGARERVGGLLGIGVAVPGRVHAADPAAREAGDDGVELTRAKQACLEPELARDRQPRLEARHPRVVGGEREVAALDPFDVGAQLALQTAPEAVRLHHQRHLVLALVGGAVGGGLAYVYCDGASLATLNFNTFSQVAFDFRVTRDLLVQGLAWALAIGAAGGLLPAVRAARLPVTVALRTL